MARLVSSKHRLGWDLPYGPRKCRSGGRIDPGKAQVRILHHLATRTVRRLSTGKEANPVAMPNVNGRDPPNLDLVCAPRVDTGGDEARHRSPLPRASSLA